MRIISGKFKGRRFNPPVDISFTRPTMDVAREGVFNILANNYDFEELAVLDLFGGTGSISFEFLSRGSEDVTLVELSRNMTEYCRKIAEILRVNLNIVKGDVLKFLKKTDKKFDIIFADPPYDYKMYFKLINNILELELLKENGIFILEHDQRNDFSKDYQTQETRIYGTNRFTFFLAQK
jgi:16S rRNA (guanine(966)-N(2))-methyltransferase RsmD